MRWQSVNDDTIIERRDGQMTIPNIVEYVLVILLAHNNRNTWTFYGYVYQAYIVASVIGFAIQNLKTVDLSRLVYKREC